jgi:hypothetical protein
LWITPKSREPGTGNGEPETWGHLFSQSKAGTGVTSAESAERGARSAECGTRSAERGMTTATAKARGHAGTQVLRHSGTKGRGRGARKLPKRQTAADGRESGFGGRRPGFAARGSPLVACRLWPVSAFLQLCALNSRLTAFTMQTAKATHEEWQVRAWHGLKRTSSATATTWIF